METGSLIIYTSADSVFQIAAHEDVVPVKELYEYCQIARDILKSDIGVMSNEELYLSDEKLSSLGN